MLKKVSSILLILLLIGCEKTEYKYTCDSGFSTGWQRHVYLDDGGVIRYGVSMYKIKPGEICHRSMLISKKI